MGTTMSDIAKKMGLSVSTISMALHNHPSISENTRERVWAAADTMNYSKHLHSTVEAPQYLQLIIYKKHGNVVADTQFFTSLFQGIEYAAKKRNHNLLISYFYENQNPQEQVNSILSSHCRGIILLATEMFQSDLKIFMNLDIPMVILDSYFPQAKFDCIGINNVQGACAAVSYLIACGHTEIGYLSSKVTIRNFYERAEGYRKGIRSISAENQSRLKGIKVLPTAEGAATDMQEYLKAEKNLPTAFFADNDIIASSCIRALKEFGYRVPEDISVIGFDDIPTCEVIDPPLTTVHVFRENLGSLAVDRLLNKISGDANEIIRIQVATTIVERKSVFRRS